jgi:hypothetical protein
VILLNLVDDASSTHIITNGSWVNGVAKPGKKPGAPTVNQTYNGNDSAAIGPFNTAVHITSIVPSTKI